MDRSSVRTVVEAVFAIPLVAVLVALSSQQTPTISKNAILGDPARREQVIRRQGYDVLYDGTRRNPLWVQYHVVPADFMPTVSRPPKFRIDRMLPSEWRVSDSDYDNTGFDRGHMSPEADQRRNQETADDAMILSNVCPQSPELNRGAWRMLEARVRELALEADETVVVTGPAFEARHCTIGDSEIMVPGGFWKAVALRNGSQWRVRCFVAGQSDGALPVDRLGTSLLQVEQLSGFELFPELKIERDHRRIVGAVHFGGLDRDL